MKIQQVVAWRESVPLTRPYTIAYSTHSDVDLVFLELRSQTGVLGWGSASPAEGVTGETIDLCESALAEDQLSWLIGRDLRDLGSLAQQAATQLAETPAARAALDIALWDLFAKQVDRPLVDILGRHHSRLPTSITIGIKSTEEALDECREYLERGFRHLKVKIGSDVQADIERVAKLHEIAGPDVAIRVDANQGYSPAEAERFFQATRNLGLELIEQPLAASATDALRELSAPLRQRVAADESLHSEKDAFGLAHPPRACGIYNIKLMKSGGISPSLSISTIASAAGIELMWGCMDESRISIAAALHAAFASPMTRYLDLDGSFDLARDPFVGGFDLQDGYLSTLDLPGLGVQPRQENR